MCPVPYHDREVNNDLSQCSDPGVSPFGLPSVKATPVEVVDPSLTKEEREKFLQFG